METIIAHDIIIVGGGAAGLRAAIAAIEINPKLNIAIISKVYPTRSHTVSAEGGIAAAISNEDNIEKHAEDTIKGSDYLADQNTVEFFVQNCKKEIELLEQWGCPWSRTKEGKIDVRAFGGMNTKRTVFAADKTGFFMLHNLFERTLLHKNIHRYDEWYVTKIFTNDNEVQGILAINQKEGELVALKAKKIIIATGGAGRIYKDTTNSTIKTGDGMALAYREGATLKDMEFVQFHPTTLPKTGILITEAVRGEGGHLYNKNNERFLEKYLPDKKELGPRDMISRAIINEYTKGNGFSGPNGNYVNLDITHLDKKTVKERLPQVIELVRDYAEIDPLTKPIPVTPSQHYTMGGIHTNTNGETEIKGLYAIGESACVGIHGANRLGSNSLAECLVFGKQTGESVAKNINPQKENTLKESQINEEQQRISKLLSKSGNENQYDILLEMRETMSKNAGIIRSNKSLAEGLTKIKKLKEKMKNIKINETNKIFNSELINSLELENMLDIAETILISSIERKESRGSHFNKDYPSRDDKNYLIHHLIKSTKKGPEIIKTPVNITKWEPTKRTY